MLLYVAIKMGFETPMNKWIGENYKTIFEEINAGAYSFLKIDNLRKKFDLNQAGTNEIKLLFKLLVLAKWKKAFS